MSKTYSVQSFPSPIPEKRFARNASLATTSAAFRAARSINYSAAEQGRQLFLKAYDTQSQPPGSATVESDIWAIFRTGTNVKSLVVWVGLAPVATRNSNEPYVAILID